MENLKNKKAVITGGSRGIGKAIALEYVKCGAEVFLVARNAEELQQAHRELSAFGSVHSMVVDMSEEDEVKRLKDAVTNAFGTLDILVNAAGVYGPIGPTTEVSPKEWERALRINLVGPFLGVHFLVPLMTNPTGGSVINFVGGGEGAYPNVSSYVSAKGGIARFTETVAAELKERKIWVNAISPGAVNTKLLDDFLAAGPEKAGKENYERALKQHDSGGVSADGAAGLAAFLASSKAEGISGKVISAVAPYETFPEHKEDIMSSDVYNVRRIWPEDRGFTWGKVKK